jgi:hypothetical protein
VLVQELKGKLMCISHSVFGDFEFECDDNMVLLGFEDDRSLWKIDNSMTQHSVIYHVDGCVRQVWQPSGSFNSPETITFAIRAKPDIVLRY